MIHKKLYLRHETFKRFPFKRLYTLELLLNNVTEVENHLYSVISFFLIIRMNG